jgi:sugar lactone lactonase YvrE
VTPISALFDKLCTRGKNARHATAGHLFSVGILFSFAAATLGAFGQISLPKYGYINTVAGNGTQGYNGNNILATNADLSYPAAVAVDENGNVYFADQLNMRIRKVTASTGVITTVAGNGGQGYNGDNILAINAELNHPGKLMLDASGNIYFSDEENNRIRKVTILTGIITTVAGNGNWGGALGNGGPATSAELYGPGGMALDSYGNLYIADAGNSLIRVVYSSGSVPNLSNLTAGDIYTVAGTGTAGYNGDNILATGAELNSPTDVKLDGYNNIYLTDIGNNRVRMVAASTGIITTVAGTGLAGYNGDNQLALGAELNWPAGVAVDAGDNVYIADGLNNRIRKVTNGFITTVAGNGTLGYNGDGELAIDAELNEPVDVALDASDNIYIADSANQRVRAVGGELTANIFNPLYKVVSVLYSPPGNQSAQGYGTSTTNGTTTTVGNSFTSGTTFMYSLPVISDLLSGSTGYSTTESNSYAFTETFMDAITTTTGDNSSTTFNPTASNDIIHNLDTFEIWLNPLVTVFSNGNTPITYTVAANPPTVNGSPSPIADIVGIPAITMEPTPAGVTALNPSGTAGITTIPEDLLAPIRIAQNSGVDAYMPGLGAVCANNTLYQAELAADNAAEVAGENRQDSYCTQANQCGCTPNDFVPILLTDPLLFSSATTLSVTSVQGGTWGSTSTAYYILVTLSGNTPAAGDSAPNWYTFSGLTNYTALNGQTLGTATPSQLGATNPLPVPATNQAVFSFGSTVFGPTSDTGQALLAGPINPYAGTVSPLHADTLPNSAGPGSGTSCGLNTVPTTANCRYVVVPSTTPAPGTGSENAVPLTELMEGGVSAPAITLTDSTTTAETIGGSQSSSMSTTFGLLDTPLSLKIAYTWTWTDSESVGNSYGSANSMSATLKSSTTACDEEASIFEDTVYHTFAFSVPSSLPQCNPGTFSITAAPVDGSQPALSLGHSMNYTVNVSALYGFTGTVALTVSGLPAGVTASFSPASITTSGSATLTLTAAYSASTYIGQSATTIKGKRGSSVVSTDVSLTTQPLQYRGDCGID